MTKAKTPAAAAAAKAPKPATTTARHHRNSLAQTRLAGPCDNLKTVRRRAPTPAAAADALRQPSLASFGFSKQHSSTPPTPAAPSTADKTPPAKRRKQLLPPPPEEVVAVEEVPETQQCDQLTQSPGFDHSDASGAAYSSPLPPPPQDEGGSGSQASVSSRVAMPPPPVTPKRRRVLEIPDSKSPPTTPFSPYQQSQPEEAVRQLLSSPTSRLGGALAEAGEDAGFVRALKRTDRRLFAASPKRPREEDEEGEGECGGTRPGEAEEELRRRESLTETTSPAKGAPATGGGRTIESSQWWEVEEDASFSTQATQSRAETASETQDTIATVILSSPYKPGTGIQRARELEQEQETFRVDLTYKSDAAPAPESQDPNRTTTTAGNYEEESQGSFHSMTYPLPPQFRDDTPDSKTEDAAPRASTNKTATRAHPPSTQQDPHIHAAVEDTASEEDPDPDPFDDDDDDEAPYYKPYHTQQLPSSFWQTTGTYPQQPEPTTTNDLLTNSQWIPDAIRRTFSTATTTEPSQWAAPGIVHVDDEREASQFLPGTGAPPSPSPEPAVFPEPADSQKGRQTQTQTQTQTFGGRYNVLDHDDDEDITIATSQLLPSELMETFPMPPPLSQYSSYGYGDLSFGESETQE